MELKSGNVGRIYQLKDSEYRKNTVSGFFSTREGLNTDGTKKYSSWNTYFVGKAYEKALELSEGDYIKLLEAKVENYYAKEKETLYVNVTVFDFELSVLEKDDE
ncbi:hypothetical protein M2140_001800 [Clostridiales Family XIII bacterium PM5-7]